MLRNIYNTGLRWANSIYQTGTHAYQTATQWTSQTVGAVRARWAEAARAITAHTAMRFANSLVGRQILSMQAENAAEGLGSLGAKYALQPVSAQLGRAIGTTIAQKTSTLISPLLLVCKALHTASTGRILSTDRLVHRALEFMILIMLVTSSGFGLRFGSEGISQILKEFEQDIGELLIKYGAGIIASFSMMKLTGTGEVFLDRDNITRSYPFKAIQSALLCDVMDNLGYTPSNQTLNFITGLLLGSLFYNLLDLKDFFLNFSRGALLDDTLPARIELPKLLQSEQVQATLVTLANKVVEKRTALLQSFDPNFVSKEGKKILKQHGYAEFQKWIAKNYPEHQEKIEQALEYAPALSALYNQLGQTKSQTNLQKVLQDEAIELLQTYVEPLYLEAAQQKIAEKLEEYQVAEAITNTSTLENLETFTKNTALALLARSVNLYFHLLREFPQIRQAMDDIHRDFAHEPLEVRRQALLQLLGRDELLQQGIHNYLNLNAEDSVQRRLQLIQHLPSLPEGYMKTSRAAIARSMDDAEELLVGMPIASQEQRAAQLSLLQKHLEPILFLAPLIALSPRDPIEEGEMQRFYTHLSQIAFEYYSPIIGARTASWIQSLTEGQLRQTRLR